MPGLNFSEEDVVVPELVVGSAVEYVIVGV
jgi:hypothetical protein